MLIRINGEFNEKSSVCYDNFFEDYSDMEETGLLKDGDAVEFISQRNGVQGIIEFTHRSSLSQEALHAAQNSAERWIARGNPQSCRNNYFSSSEFNYISEAEYFAKKFELPTPESLDYG